MGPDGLNAVSLDERPEPAPELDALDTARPRAERARPRGDARGGGAVRLARPDRAGQADREELVPADPDRALHALDRLERAPVRPVVARPRPPRRPGARARAAVDGRRRDRGRVGAVVGAPVRGQRALPRPRGPPDRVYRPRA